MDARSHALLLGGRRRVPARVVAGPPPPLGLGCINGGRGLRPATLLLPLVFVVAAPPGFVVLPLPSVRLGARTDPRHA